MKGVIRAVCPACNTTIKVEVDFPSFDAGFTTKQVCCKNCGVCLVVADHQYNDDGTIKEA